MRRILHSVDEVFCDLIQIGGVIHESRKNGYSYGVAPREESHLNLSKRVEE
jgi:hypothetical protein